MFGSSVTWRHLNLIEPPGFIPGFFYLQKLGTKYGMTFYVEALQTILKFFS